jgi:hypothetical protein
MISQVPCIFKDALLFFPLMVNQVQNNSTPAVALYVDRFVFFKVSYSNIANFPSTFIFVVCEDAVPSWFISVNNRLLDVGELIILEILSNKMHQWFAYNERYFHIIYSFRV